MNDSSPSMLRRSLVVVGLSLALSGSMATAAADSGSNWWYDYYSVDEAHTAGWTGRGVTIAVLDSGINTATPALQGVDITVDPQAVCATASGERRAVDSEDMSIASHGSNVTAFIVGNGSGPSSVRGIAPDAHVLFYGYGTENKDKCYGGSWGDAIFTAVDAGADIITTSIGWDASSAYGEAAIAYALAHGVIVLASQPNSTVSLGVYPGALNGVVHSGAYNPNGNIEHDETIDGAYAAFPDTTVVAPGEELLTIGDSSTGDWSVATEGAGTSFATPMIAAALADVWQKYPDATSNQILQSLIRNTTLDDHPLLRDTEKGYGYGPVSLTHMLRVDPSQYPDENPLMDKAYAKPTLKDVATAKAAITAGTYKKPKPTSSFDGYSDPLKDGSDNSHTVAASAPFFASPVTWIIGAGILLALGISGFVWRRARRRTSGAPAGDVDLSHRTER